MLIEASALTTCAVIKDGDKISLGLMDQAGRAVEVDVSPPDASAIAMTIPRLLRAWLREKYQDPSLRHTFPLDTWHIEAESGGSQVIITLATGQGFEVSFRTAPETCRSLSSALKETTSQKVLSSMPLAN